MKIRKKNRKPQEKNPPILLNGRPVGILSCPTSPAVSLYFPLSQSAAIPFSWEHAPGVPKPICLSSLNDHGASGAGDNKYGYAGSSAYENDDAFEHEEVNVGANGGQEKNGSKGKQEDEEDEEDEEKEKRLPRAPPSSNFRGPSVRLLCQAVRSLAKRTFMQSQQQQKKNELLNAPAKNPFLKALLECSRCWTDLKSSARLGMKRIAKGTKKRCLISWSRASCARSCHVRNQVQVLFSTKCIRKAAP